MIAEIVSNGMLSLSSAIAVVGLIPGVIIIIFLGVWATFTSWVLIQSKLRNPQVRRLYRRYLRQILLKLT
jgi:amino acid permease